jgi:hypothetical protein
MFPAHSDIDIKLSPMAFKKYYKCIMRDMTTYLQKEMSTEAPRGQQPQPTASVNKVVSYKIHH